MKNDYLVFIDRDGVINFNREDHVKCLKEFLFLPRAIEALVNLSKMNVKIIIVTNQSIIEQKLATKRDVNRIHRLLKNAIISAGGRIDKIYCCPHKIGNSNCNCRKPKTEMFEKASKEFNINLKKSFIIGDQLSDIEAGKKINGYTILVRTGLGNKWLEKRKNWTIQPNKIVNNIFDAVNLIKKKIN